MNIKRNMRIPSSDDYQKLSLKSTTRLIHQQKPPWLANVKCHDLPRTFELFISNSHAISYETSFIELSEWFHAKFHMEFRVKFHTKYHFTALSCDVHTKFHRRWPWEISYELSVANYIGVSLLVIKLNKILMLLQLCLYVYGDHYYLTNLLLKMSSYNASNTTWSFLKKHH